MATNQASPAEQVSTERDGGQHTDKVAQDRDLFCPRLEQFLCTSAQAHGLRGTLASVTASIERGGAGGGGQDPNLDMLLRIGWQQGVHFGYDRERAPKYRIGRLIETERRWRLLESVHQAILLARYLGAVRVEETVRTRFGVMAGVVFYRWLKRCDGDRKRELGPRLEKLEREIGILRAGILPFEATLCDLLALPRQPPSMPDLDEGRPTKPPAPDPTGDEKADAAALTAWRSAWLQQIRPWNFELAQRRWERREAWLAEREVIDQRIARARAELAPLLAESAKLHDQQAKLMAAGGVDGDSAALLKMCQAGEPPAALLEGAVTETRNAHRAWFKTGKAAATAWLDEAAPA